MIAVLFNARNARRRPRRIEAKPGARCAHQDAEVPGEAFARFETAVGLTTKLQP